MELFIVISLLTIGWLLVFLEIFFIPGITVFGIVGVAVMIAGYYYAFTNYGNSGGYQTIGISALLMLASLVLGFKSGLWNKLSLKESLKNSRTNEWEEGIIKVGDYGMAISKIALSGTARFNEINFEVNSESEFISPNTAIEIIKIENRKIIVQTKK